MARIESLIERVWDEMPSVTEAFALRAMADAVKEFCVRTHYWRGLVDAVPNVDDNGYSLVCPDGVSVVAVRAVLYNGEWLRPTDPHEFRRAGRADSPSRYVQWTPSKLEINAGNTTALVVHAALTLAQGNPDADVPDDLIDEYGEAIAAGAKMRLARMAGADWSMPAAAPGYAALFYAAVNTAKRRATNSLDQAELRVEMRGW